MQIEKQAGVEETAENLQCAFFESIGGHAGCDECIIVRPDRSIVVRHWIEASLSGSDGADTPSVKKLFAHQEFGQSHAVFLFGNTGPEAVTGIRRPDSTGPLAPVQG